MLNNNKNTVQSQPDLLWGKILCGFTVSGSLVAMTLSCNQGQLSGSAQKKEGSTKEQKSALNGETEKPDSDEDRRGDEPQIISGAFLTCATVDLNRTSFPKDDSKEVVGCALVRDNKKVNLAKYKNELEFKNPEGHSVPSPSEEAPQYAMWHRYGQIPQKGLPDTTAYLIVTDPLNPGVKQRFPFALSKAKDAKWPLPTPEPGDAPVPGISFMPTHLWNMNQNAANVAKGIAPESFCEGGVVRSNIQTIEKYENLPDVLVNFGFDSTIYPATAKNKLVNTAFVPLTKIDGQENPLDSPRCVLEGGGCYFVKSNRGYVYIFDGISISAGVTLAELQRQTRESLCKE